MHDRNVTGRDGYIIRTALAYAVAVIDSLPEEHRAESDRCDMVRLLNSMTTDHAFLAARVQAATGLPCNLDNLDYEELT